jgi:hypothetical protein
VTEPPAKTPRAFWIGLGLGLVPMAWGVRLYLDATPDLRRRLDLAGWLVGLDLAHDLLLAPAVVAVGLLVRRFVPARARATVQAALIVTGAVVLVGLLPLLGSARSDNATIQPIDYVPSIAVVVAVIWVVALGAGLATARRGRQRR